MYGIFPEWTWIIGFIVGAFIGSFLNVVIYRMPRGLSLGSPKHSFCPTCKHRLLMSDMIPILTWLLRKGHCGYCDAKVSSRYLWVEVANGSIWGLIWFQYFCAGNDVGKAVAYALAASALVAIIWIDWELYIIPEQINAFLAFVGIGYNIYLYVKGAPEATTWGIPSALAGWITGVAILWGIAFLGRLAFGRMAMGEGDIKMARGIGTLLFPMLAGLSFGIAVVLGVVGGLIQKFRAGKRGAPEGEVFLELEGDIVNMAGRTISLKVTQTNQDKVVSRKETLVLEMEADTEFYRGEKKIAADAFFDGLSNGYSLTVHCKSEGGKNRVVAIGRNQAQLLGLIKSGVGYLLGIDIIGLFFVKLYEKYFGENPYEVPEDLESFDAGDTMIPFGPYLAAGAILAAIFAPQLAQVVQNYLNWSGIGAR